MPVVSRLCRCGSVVVIFGGGGVCQLEDAVNGRPLAVRPRLLEEWRFVVERRAATSTRLPHGTTAGRTGRRGLFGRVDFHGVHGRVAPSSAVGRALAQRRYPARVLRSQFDRLVFVVKVGSHLDVSAI